MLESPEEGIHTMGEFVRTAGVSVWAAIEALWQVLEQVPWTVLGDIGMMTFLVYQVYVRFRGTRAARVVGGIIVLGLGGLAAQEAGLFLTAWFLGGIGAAALIFVLIIFQSEIRDMLEQVNPWLPAQLFLNRIGQGRPSEELLVTLTESIFSMAKKHCGALLVFERGTTLEPFLRSPGTLLNAELSPELIETVFTPPTPLHDGALYIQQGRAHRAGCVLPLSDNRRLASYYGTRHRAALGITEKTDALAVVVSEERGTVSVTEAGNSHRHPYPRSAPQLADPALASSSHAPATASPDAGTAHRQLATQARHPDRCRAVVVCSGRTSGYRTRLFYSDRVHKRVGWVDAAATGGSAGLCQRTRLTRNAELY